MLLLYSCFFFFFNDTATTEIYTLSLHDALPIFATRGLRLLQEGRGRPLRLGRHHHARWKKAEQHIGWPRSEEHTSELQSQSNLVCRLLLEKKKQLTAHLADITMHTPDPSSPLQH